MHYLLLNGIPLLSGDAWAKRELCQVTADSDACRLDHSGISSGERRAAKLCVIHVADMLCSLCMAVIFKNNFVHEGSECSVRVVGAGINTNA